MSIYLDSSSYLHHDGQEGPTLACPHCQAITLLAPLSIPRFSVLMAHKPLQVGVVYRCVSCNTPVFLKYPVKLYASNRVELGTHFVELEHPREKLSLPHLPALCESLLKEALTCFNHGAFTAFALVCRHLMRAAYRELGDNGRLKIFDLLAEIRDMINLDNDQFTLTKKILLDTDDDGLLPMLSAQQAGLILEVIKDVLYQSFTRQGKLQQAIKMRRFFAEQRAERNAERPVLKAVSTVAS